MRRRLLTVVAATAMTAASVLTLTTTAQADWSEWTNLGGDPLGGGPGSADGSEVYARDTAGDLRVYSHNVNMPKWSRLTNIGGPIVDSPSAVVARKTSPGPSIKEDEVYFRGTDNKVHFLGVTVDCHTGGCQPGSNDQGSVPGAITSAPAAVKLNPNRVDLFARGANKELRHTFQDGVDQMGPWAQWEDLGGTFLEHPTAVAWRGTNRLDVFVKGLDTHLWHKFWTNTQGWSPWEDLGGTLTSAPSAIVFDDNRLDIFAKGTSDTLIHKIWTATGGWSGWEDLGGRFQYSPAATKAFGRIDVHVTGSIAQLENKWWG
jgi:hypothetical protein